MSNEDRRLVSLTLRMPEDLHDALKAHAEKTGRSLNREVMRLIEDGIRAADFVTVARETIRQEMRAEFEARRTFVVSSDFSEMEALPNRVQRRN